jgi:prevent-host-death family protein
MTGSMTVKIMSATEAKNGFGRFLKAIQRGPIVITKKGSPVAITISFEDAEDLALLGQAKKAGEKGFVGVETSEAILAAVHSVECKR